MALSRVGQVFLFVRDLARAHSFYSDVLGLPHLYTYGDLAFFDMAGVRLYLHAVPPDEWRPGLDHLFDVADIHAEHGRLVGANVPATSEPHIIFRHPDGIEEWLAHFEDLEGNQLALLSRVRPA